MTDSFTTPSTRTYWTWSQTHAVQRMQCVKCLSRPALQWETCCYRDIYPVAFISSNITCTQGKQLWVCDSGHNFVSRTCSTEKAHQRSLLVMFNWAVVVAFPFSPVDLETKCQYCFLQSPPLLKKEGCNIKCWIKRLLWVDEFAAYRRRL